MRPYDSIRHQLDSGDLVLFRGDSVYSRIIQRPTRTAWSHVGLVLRLPEYDYLALSESIKIRARGWLRSNSGRPLVKHDPLPSLP